LIFALVLVLVIVVVVVIVIVIGLFGVFRHLQDVRAPPLPVSLSPRLLVCFCTGFSALLFPRAVRKIEPPMAESVAAIYPGSFDPVTNGHLDIIERGRRMFSRVIVAVLVNAAKEPLFSVQERLQMLAKVTAGWHNVEIDTFDGLLVNFAQRRGAQVILRGIRAVTDYEYEFQMALMNRRLAPGIETVFIFPAEAYSYLSSSLVKEVSSLGGSVGGLVPASVEESLLQKIRTKNRG